MVHPVTLLLTEFVTHDVRRFIFDWPEALEYEPGQGVELMVDEPEWQEEGRPFTPTSLREARVLEFTIKGYPEHHGVTEKLHSLKPGARVRLTDAFGTIAWKGPGTFIAAGAGITPFLAIMRDRAERNELGDSRLLFSNKTPADVICEKELKHYFGERCWLTCTKESAPGYDDRRIDKDLLQEKIEDFQQNFYVCGPPAFVDDIKQALTELGASPDTVVFEQ